MSPNLAQTAQRHSVSDASFHHRDSPDTTSGFVKDQSRISPGQRKGVTDHHRFCVWKQRYEQRWIQLAFSTGNAPDWTIWSSQTDSGTPEKIWEGSQPPQLWDWSPDSKTLLVGLKQVMHGLDAGSGKMNELARHPQYRLYNFYFSPDGRWIAFEAGISRTETACT